jgi:putative ABC transport system permease protein
MKTPVAWLNLVHQTKRTLVAVAGVAFAVLLVFMQLGFYGAAEGTATIVYDELNFDVMLTSPQYIDINRAGTFPETRMSQALAVPGVAEAEPMNVAFGAWRNADAPPRYASRPQNIMVMGVRPQDTIFRTTQKNLRAVYDQFRDELQKPGEALIDTQSHAEFGDFSPGHSVEVGPQRIDIAGQFTLGTGFGANGLIIVSDETFLRIYPWYPPDRASLGLLRLAPGADANEVARRLRAALPDDVTALTRDEVAERERRQWVEKTSLGLIFRLGVGVALFVGVVFVYQVISSDIANRLHEFATLKAMGYGPLYLAGVVLQQAFFIALLAYGPGLVGSLVLYTLTRGTTGVPIGMNFGRAVLVLTLTLGMCAVSGIFALRKVQSADPAELF